MNILGLSAFYHDSAACLIRDGELIAAAQEERFTRKKHDSAFPRSAVQYCLEAAGLASGAELDLVAFYEKPFLKCDRIFSTYLAVAPSGLRSFLKAVPVWIKQKIWIKDIIRKELGFDGQILFPEHHESHAASAFFPSPFPDAAILTIDGVGEWTTTSIGRGSANQVELLSELQFPHSLGLLYSAFTYYLGFRVNSGEYKVMGLAPYGEPAFRDLILSELIDLKADGSFCLNLRYFDFVAGLTMTNREFERLLGDKVRSSEAALTRRHADVARSIQAVAEEVMLRLARQAQTLTGAANLCLAGGVALNCVGNGRILREGPFERVWIQPAAGDAGGAIGAALLAWHHHLGKARAVLSGNRAQKASLLGPEYDAQAFLQSENIPHRRLDENELVPLVSTHLAQGKTVGWYQGRMEFGPRALGNRSILADPRPPDMQEKLNLQIKFRESFRPFAPAVLSERVSDYFELKEESPYMLFVAPVSPRVRLQSEVSLKSDTSLSEQLKAVHSTIPAVTHVDDSARVQTVSADDHPRFHRLLVEFERRTGCPLLVNTSFNVRGEPPVCTPQDAYRCFMKTGLDYLVLGDCVLDKREQPPLRTISTDKPRTWIAEEYHQLDRSPKALRRFGLTLAAALIVLTALFIYRAKPSAPFFGAAALLAGAIAIFAPGLLLHVHRIWMTGSLLIGWLMTRIILTLVFVFAVTPIALIQRCLGKSALELRCDPARTSYWKQRKTELSNYAAQY